MKYKNANSILPAELIESIQKYVQGEYIYIPIKEKQEPSIPSEYSYELQKRNAHIYTNSLQGINNKQLSETYHLSESSIRRILINQRKRYEIMKNRIKHIITNWNITNPIFTQIYDTAWQIGNEYILKVYENPDMLERNIKIITILDNMEIPTGKIILSKKETTYIHDDKYYYILLEKMQGSNIVSLKNNLALAAEMGEILARLHIAFKECEIQNEFWDNSLLNEMNGWVRNFFQDTGWKYIDEKDFDKTVLNLKNLYDKLPVQLIHRDVHFGNFLFAQGRFSGYIDFDLSQRNIRIFDLCYFCIGLLSEEEYMDITKEEWFELLGNVFMGYRRKLALSLEEIQAVPYVMESIELLFAAWFFGEKDLKCAKDAIELYKFVQCNEQKIVHSIK
ncbi:MAG: phosphotransferase [Lachnospiraceae bacterium]|nr:phosphotransferase [Lachnospiraceae bacterium]